jgi:Xaa-Pro dipeptidase
LKTLKEFRQERIRTAMEQRGVDVLIASLPEHILYLTGFTALGATYHAKTQAYGVYCPAKDSIILVNSMVDAPTAIDHLPNAELHCFGAFRFAVDPQSKTAGILAQKTHRIYDSVGDALADAVRKAGNGPLKIALDELRTPIQTWERLRAEFPQHQIVPALSLFERVRQIKHPDEIALLEQAAHMAEDSLLAMLEQVKVGTSEWEMDRIYRAEVAKRGGNGYFITATADRRSSFSDTCCTQEQKVQDGSILRFDYGAAHQFFCSDLARTAIVGKRNETIESLYSYILDGVLEMEHLIKPGAVVSQLYQTAMEAVRKGIPDYYRHHVGHGIGMLINDNPVITSSNHTLLEEGMVLCIETPYYLYDSFGIQIEYMVEVTANGSRRLTKHNNGLIYIPAR